MTGTSVAAHEAAFWAEKAAELEEDLRVAQLERDEARAHAAVLAHAYDHDTRPPDASLAAARTWRRAARPR